VIPGINITQPATALDATVTHTDVACNSAAGTITVTATGGSAPYFYFWNASNGGVIPAGQGNTNALTGLVAGTYTVTIVDANLCVITRTVVIAGTSSSISLTLTPTNIPCSGGSTGAVNLLINGGIGTYTITWSASNGGIIPAGQVNSQNLTGLVAGTYTATVMDGNGCSATQSVTIIQASTIAVTLTPTAASSCTAANGAITASVTGGTAPFTYTWVASNGGIIPAGQVNSLNLTGLTGGTYTLTVMDANGCAGTQSATITQPNGFTVAATSTPLTNCALPDGSVSITIAGGSAPFTFVWTATNNGVIPAGQVNSQNLTGLIAGTYTVTVTDANGCTGTASASIAVNPACGGPLPPPPGSSLCTYTQGYYGNLGGMSCTNGVQTTTLQRIQAALDAVGGTVVFGNVANNRYFTISNANDVIRLLPGGGPSRAFHVYAGGASLGNTASWTSVPLRTNGSQAGRIYNALFAQTLTLFLNMQNSTALADLPVNGTVCTQNATDCGSNTPSGSGGSCFSLHQYIVSYLSDPANGYTPTIAGLYQLANDVLGGVNTTISASAVESAVDHVNESFDECQVVVTSGRPNTATPVVEINAAPNPYSDRITFTVRSQISGNSSFELFGLTGERVAQIYQGRIERNVVRTFSYTPMSINRRTLIYRFSVKGQVVTGKVLHMN